LRVVGLSLRKDFHVVPTSDVFQAVLNLVRSLLKSKQKVKVEMPDMTFVSKGCLSVISDDRGKKLQFSVPTTVTGISENLQMLNVEASRISSPIP
jgi:hypothetical protein